MKLLTLGLLLSALAGCAQENTSPSDSLLPNYSTTEKWSCARTPTITRDLNKKDILVIGDSISIAYTPFLRNIKTDFNVLHNDCNAAWSGYTAYRIDKYLELDTYEVIIFNNGIWDLTSKAISVDHYIANLRKTAMKIKEKTARPIFVTTTYSWDTDTNQERWDIFNARATQLMNELGIEVIDMYPVSVQAKGLLTGDGTHYQDAGSEIFAQKISEFIQ